MNGKVTIANMPRDMAFEFQDGRYVFKTVLSNGTRDDNYAWDDREIEYTEVYRFLGDGSLSREWSGRLTDNPGIYGPNGLDKNNCFSIFSYDMDTSARFEQTKELTYSEEVTNIITGRSKNR